MEDYIYVRYIYDITMILKSNIRKYGGSTYAKIPPAFVEYYNLDKYLERCRQKGIDPECKVEYKDDNKIIITFTKW